MRKLSMVLALAGLAGAMAPGAAMARDYNGAIAYSSATGAHGYSYDYDTRDGAEQRALNECAGYGGGCEAALWFRNACGALAVGADGWGTGWDINRSGAESNAIAKCSQFS